jgi:Fe-S-cluster containining protein
MRYQFDETACQGCRGRCCRGLRGYVWISGEEVEAMAAAKAMDKARFSRSFVRQVNGRLALQERCINGEYLCCLLDPLTGRCTLYPQRPQQCKRFPFWDQDNLTIQDCPGITHDVCQYRVSTL